jgi:WD40 repeat protein
MKTVGFLQGIRLTRPDVQDLAWSPDNHLLVSVGLDSAIMIWNAQTFGKYTLKFF